MTHLKKLVSIKTGSLVGGVIVGAREVCIWLQEQIRQTVSRIVIPDRMQQTKIIVQTLVQELNNLSATLDVTNLNFSAGKYPHQMLVDANQQLTLLSDKFKAFRDLSTPDDTNPFTQKILNNAALCDMNILNFFTPPTEQEEIVLHDLNVDEACDDVNYLRKQLEVEYPFIKIENLEQKLREANAKILQLQQTNTDLMQQLAQQQSQKLGQQLGQQQVQKMERNSDQKLAEQQPSPTANTIVTSPITHYRSASPASFNTEQNPTPNLGQTSEQQTTVIDNYVPPTTASAAIPIPKTRSKFTVTTSSSSSSSLSRSFPTTLPADSNANIIPPKKISGVQFPDYESEGSDSEGSVHSGYGDDDDEFKPASSYINQARKIADSRSSVRHVNNSSSSGSKSHSGGPETFRSEHSRTGDGSINSRTSRSFRGGSSSNGNNNSK